MVSTQLLLLSPLIAPLAAAAFAALGRRWNGVQRAVTFAALVVVIAAGVLLVVESLSSGVVSTVVGAKSSLTGIALTADPFGAALVAATGVLAAVVTATVVATGDDRSSFLQPLMLVLLGGACGSFLAGDLFNLFVFFEVVLIGSYVLLILLGGLPQLRAARVYVTVNLIGTMLLLTGIAGVFAATGTVNLARLAQQPVVESGAAPGAVLVVLAFTVKAGLLPFSGWLAVGYPVVQRTTMALFAGTLTTVGVAALYRVVLLAFDGSPVLRGGVLVVAVATLLLASVAAVAAHPHGRVLGLLIVTQVGFMAAGFGLGTAAAVTAGVFFVLQDVVIKAAAVLAYRPLGESAAPGGGARAVALTGFALLALSLVGVPPLAGFVGKALLVEAAFEAGSVVVVVAVLVASAATLAALLPLWWHVSGRGGGESGGGASSARLSACVTPAVAVAAAALVVGIAPGWLLAVAEGAAEVLVDPAVYARQVLGS
ncbi:proton-conducting transporter membrane subunit [Actinopolyspora saharensis]|uniref:Multicomponent Na+:H+ antiporter subunit D n=1 Tax=Actinopolyspora saharensis TaxID=995062 RepID=A0A1H0YW94_9ACTN|nr:proton-conducting transporter membrane subunit [Actinopolyspora saharensis]SDQ19507.1 multicomponent Na+:H+ antiporter subunit D [Actinopolyspora saharensis]